jgi:hypothetical protein
VLIDNNTEQLWRITSRTFCAGAIARNGSIVEAAPILFRTLRGRRVEDAAALTAARGWQLDIAVWRYGRWWWVRLDSAQPVGGRWV